MFVCIGPSAAPYVGLYLLRHLSARYHRQVQALCSLIRSVLPAAYMGFKQTGKH